MRTLKLALAAVAAFAFNANAQTGPIGMGQVPTGFYQQPVEGSPPNGQAFHAGGVAACDGCHVMHNASSGVAKATTGFGQSVQPWTNVTNMYLLQGSDQSSTCLVCHGANTVAANVQFTVADTQIPAGGAPENFTPGGDFGWLTLTFAAAQGGAASPGARHGHNVVAADYPTSFAPDTLLTAPGGSFTASTGVRAFACSNCHDPHGRYRVQAMAGTPNGLGYYGPTTPGADLLPIAASGSYGDMPDAAGTYAVGAYRLLAGQNYAPASNPSYPFPNDPPFAVAPAAYNRNEGTAGEVKVAYGTGMSEWCQNCHTNVHLDGYTTGVAGLRHPAGSEAFLHAGQYEVYNAYVSSGDMTGTNNYTSLVPFEQGPDLDLGELLTQTTAAITAGPTSSVMCLSCHRAHASAFDNMVRWDQNATFLTDGDSYTGGLTLRDATVTQAGYYGRTYEQLGVYQRSLCNKCHGKD